MNHDIASLGRRVLDGGVLNREELQQLADSASSNPFDLMYWAYRVREKHFSNAVRFCSIIPGKSGACSEDCKWCAQSAACSDGMPLSRTPMEDIHAAAARADERGATCFGIVNSGRHPSSRDVADAIAAAGEMRRRHPELGLCASLGELTPQQARQLASGGVKRYNHNLESSRRFYATVVTSHAYDDRIATLQAASAAGMQLCCGGIFGLGESWADRIDLALTLRSEIRPAVAPLNFLHPVPGTPLQDRPRMEPLEILTIIALFRLAMPTIDLKVAGGREMNLRDMQSWIFYAGATSVIIGNYLTTTGQPVERDMQMLADMGLRVVRGLNS